MAGTVNKPKKPKSKRGTSRLRHKIEKASVAKQRKQRKLARKNPEWRSKLKKDPGIPNLFPYKERLLEEAEERRVRRAAEVLRKREMAKAARTGVVAEDGEPRVDPVEAGGVRDADDDDDDDMDDAAVDESNPLAALLASAKAAATQYDRELADSDGMDDDDDEDDDDGGAGEFTIGQAPSRKSYDKVSKQVVEQADVVLYVLDARDPEGTRSREVERSIMAAAASSGKRLILVLNKVDLVPAAVLRAWLVYLRRYFPTLPLRASGAASNARTFNHGDLTVQSTSATLFRALKSFAATRQLKRAISVGVIGYPNVGKSSVINALLARMSGRAGGGSSKACPAGAEAGVTTSIRAVKIDNKLTLLDSPGVVFPSSSSSPASSGGLVSLKNAAEAHAHLVLLNAVPPKQIDDPVPAVSLLIRRLSLSPDLMQKLTDVYDIPPLLPDAGDVTTDFLVQVARKRGRLGRGGVPNLTSAAMTVVTDWRDGRIQGWVEPPSLDAADSATGPAARVDATVPDQKEIVTEWAAEFKLEGLWGDDAAVDAGGDAMEQ
ncbi:hypothetical protein G6O67_002503 [Ophiocordyceps sinensis]|uniref:CP-type G domain-containing protein n=1 Tax=Ophiocordyceps sinensis TaxID=72228 RepID=A0A8H4PUF8_9HYPO|nr:hypothetical protein G6O67_002503 [Ophiocordyceps sinensis]